MKRPAFQFYPADWRKDAALQSCSIEARGMWIEAMCIAHECEPYGHLTVNGRAMNASQIGRLVGVQAKDATRLLGELLEAGVASKADSGSIFSRRMVRDEDLRNVRAAAGRLGGNPALLGTKVKVVVKQTAKQVPTPSSSPSSSPSGNPPNPRKRGKRASAPDSPLFERFYTAYPRKVAPDAARKAFDRIAPDEQIVDAMVRAVKAQGLRERMLAGEKQFVPHPATWLNDGRWKDAPDEGAAEASEWWETRRGAEAKAAELGLPKWDECSDFRLYVGKVRVAMKETA